MKLNSLLLSGFAFVNGADELPRMIDYQQLYLPDPKIVMGGEPPKDFVENKYLIERNKRWIAQRDDSKEVVKKMINIPNTIPIAPHVAYKTVDNTPYCWVFYPYHSEEDEVGPIYEFATHLAEYYYERCAVGTIDLAYPSNQFMFGYLIDDTPMLFVRNSGPETVMLNRYIEKGSFTLKDWNEWGYRVTSDKLEDDLDGELNKILKRSYDGQSDFSKINAVYIEWYRSNEQISKTKIKGKQTILDLIKNSSITKDEEGKDKQVTKTEAFKWFDENYDLVVTTLESEGLDTAPKPLIKLNNKFKKYRDEL